jgi:hypothetical protein
MTSFFSPPIFFFFFFFFFFFRGGGLANSLVDINSYIFGSEEMYILL